MSADLLQRLAEAGTPLSLVMEVAEALADARAAERLLQARREKDAARQQDKRDRDSDERHVMSRDSMDVTTVVLDKENVPGPLKEINPREKDNLPAREALDLPEGITGELWDQYRAMRRKIRKPLSPHAEQLALKHLRKFAEDGHPPGQIVEAAIVGSYQGLFAPKASKNGHAKPKPDQPWGSTVAAAESLIADIQRARGSDVLGEAPAPGH